MRNEVKGSELSTKKKLFYRDNLAIHVAKPANVFKEIISTAMAALHLQNLYCHLPQILSILYQRIQGTHLLFSIQWRSYCDDDLLKARDLKHQVHLQYMKTITTHHWNPN